MQQLQVPRLGQTMESGTILEWLKDPGEAFELGEPIYEIETEKAVNEVEATIAGRIVRRLVDAGTQVDVGTMLAVIAEPDEDPTEEDIDAYLAERLNPPSETMPSTESAPTTAVPTGAATGERIRAMPKARKRAQELGVDLADVIGTGDDGSITVADVETATSAGSSSPGTNAAHVKTLTGLRARTATAVMRSWSEIPHFQQQVTVDMSRCLARKRELAEAGVRVTLTDLVLAALLDAVQQVPETNAHLNGDQLTIHADVNVSVAVDTPDGLVAPVLRRCQGRLLADNATSLASLVQRARNRQLTADDMTGGTITLSNLGRSRVETGFPLITAPQVAVVFVGAVQDRVVALDGVPAVRPTCTLSASFDHRVIDGVRAGRFTGRLAESLEAQADPQ